MPRNASSGGEWVGSTLQSRPQATPRTTITAHVFNVWATQSESVVSAIPDLAGRKTTTPEQPLQGQVEITEVNTVLGTSDFLLGKSLGSSGTTVPGLG